MRRQFLLQAREMRLYSRVHHIFGATIPLIDPRTGYGSSYGVSRASGSVCIARVQFLVNLVDIGVAKIAKVHFTSWGGNGVPPSSLFPVLLVPLAGT